MPWSCRIHAAIRQRRSQTFPAQGLQNSPVNSLRVLCLPFHTHLQLQGRRRVSSLALTALPGFPQSLEQKYLFCVYLVHSQSRLTISITPSTQQGAHTTLRKLCLDPFEVFLLKVTPEFCLSYTSPFGISFRCQFSIISTFSRVCNFNIYIGFPIFISLSAVSYTLSLLLYFSTTCFTSNLTQAAPSQLTQLSRTP